MDDLNVLLVSEWDRRTGSLRRGPMLRLTNAPPEVNYQVIGRSSLFEAPANYTGLSMLSAAKYALRQLVRFLSSPIGEGYDLVHSFFIDLSRYSPPWIHESDQSIGQYLKGYFSFPEGLVRLLVRPLVERLNSDSCKAVITWSMWAARGFAEDGVDKAKVYVIPPPMNVKARAPHSGVNVLLIARDPYRKGVDLALRSFIKLAKYYDDVRLTLVGTALSDDVKLSLRGRVVDYERVSEPLLHNVIMPATDIVLAPSRAEAYNLTVLEAMAHGAVPVVTDVGGMPELVKDGGLIVRADNEDELYDALEELASDQELRSKLSARATEIVNEEHDPESIGLRLYKVYRASLEG